jgi:hypothetical protein
MHRFAPVILSAILAVTAAPQADAQGCRTDRLGNVICRDLPRQSPPPLRLGRPAPPEEPARETPTIAGSHTDAFGETRPPRLSVTGERPFGARPRPVAPLRACTSDTFGTIRCR